MKIALERTSQPAVEPMTLAEMKAALRMFANSTSLDATVTDLIVAAREWVEAETGRALVDQGWLMTVNPSGALPNAVTTTETLATDIHLRKSPVLSIESISTVDAAGAVTALASDTYELRAAASKYPKVVMLNGATFANGEIRIAFRAGFVDRASSPLQEVAVIPAMFRQAMKLWTEAQLDRDKDMMDKLVAAACQLLQSQKCNLGTA